ncbi:MAG: threonine/serine dehydratase [Gemmatimonadota bacterium]
MITKDEIEAARRRIRPHVHETPLVTSIRMGNAAGVELLLKCESMQRAGSFKSRGALNAMMQLSPEERAKGVVTVSAGNHAQSLAWAATLVGAECTACMPEGASPTKVKATQGYGGTVELVPGERVRAFERARELAAQGRVMVHPFDDARVAAGAGTVALEMLEQRPDLEAIVVPIGGGGLITGIALAAKAVKPGIRIIGVEPEGAPTMKTALEAGSPQTITPKTIADGLSAPMVGAMNLEVVRSHVDELVLVTDDDILAAMRDLMSFAKLVVEPAGAASVAAIRSGKTKFKTGTRVAAIISGGNVDLDRLKALL